MFSTYDIRVPNKWTRHVALKNWPLAQLVLFLQETMTNTTMAKVPSVETEAEIITTCLLQTHVENLTMALL